MKNPAKQHLFINHQIDQFPMAFCKAEQLVVVRGPASKAYHGALCLQREKSLQRNDFLVLEGCLALLLIIGSYARDRVQWLSVSGRPNQPKPDCLLSHTNVLAWISRCA